MIDPIQAPCEKTFYPAYRFSGTRKLSDIKWIVLHSTEGGTALSVAQYFFGPSAGGSTHLVVDDKECYRCLPNSAVCWGAASAPSIKANDRGFHIEQCGFAAWSIKTWFTHLPTLRRAAYKTAYHAERFKLPLVFVDYADILAGKKGVTTHYEITKASKIADPANASRYDHTDPGPRWPRWLFMRLARKYAKELL